VQPAAPDGRGRSQQTERDKSGAESRRGGAGDRSPAPLKALPNEEAAAHQSLGRQRVVVLIQVRPPAVAEQDAAAQPTPAAKASPKE
jgi:hypothetical protein